MQLSFLLNILSQPSAPFRESFIYEILERTFFKEKIPYFFDPIGNLIVGASSEKAYVQKLQKKTKQPLRIFIAHTDHPGFHGVRWRNPKQLEVKWHGGTPTRHLTGARVWIASPYGWEESGNIYKVKLEPQKRWIESAQIRFKTPIKRPPETLFGGFGFRAPVWKKGPLIYTKAADDLAGAAVIAQTALNLKRKHKSFDHFLGLFTRAEEVGYIGALGHLRLGWLQKAKRPLLAVSIESSRTLPGADIGKGPVVRLGDRASVFEPHALHALTQIAQKILPGSHQRRVMDGGSCEASALLSFGIPAIGLSIPLGNYHNQSLQGGPDSAPPLGPAPEYVHFKDLQNLVRLVEALTERHELWEKPWKAYQKKLNTQFQHYQKLL